MILFQSSFFIVTFIYFNKKQIIFFKPKFNHLLLLNIVVSIFFMLAIYHLLSFHTYYVTDLINTANILNNINANRFFSGLVDPYIYIDDSRYSHDGGGSIQPSNDIFDTDSILFYPSGVLFSINFIQFFTNILSVLNLIKIQIYFMLFIITYLYFYIFNYLNIVNSKHASIIFHLLLIFNFFPSYLIVAGDLALLSGYVYAMIITLYHIDRDVRIISLIFHTITIVFLHPLALYVLFLGLILKRKLSHV